MTSFAPGFSAIADRDDSIKILATRFDNVLFPNLIAAFADCRSVSDPSNIVAPLDNNGQRMINTGSAINGADVVIKSQFDAGITAVQEVAVSSGAPLGSILAMAVESLPTNYLLCDGSAISRTTYADLFALIGTTYGAGDASTTFNLPDFRGQFLRGYDGGTLTAAVGTKQLSAAPKITGSFQIDTLDTTGFAKFSNNTGCVGVSTSGTVVRCDGHSSGAGNNKADINASLSSAAYGRDSTTEVRPTNFAIYYYIKATMGETGGVPLALATLANVAGDISIAGKQTLNTKIYTARQPLENLGTAGTSIAINLQTSENTRRITITQNTALNLVLPAGDSTAEFNFKFVIKNTDTNPSTVNFNSSSETIIVATDSDTIVPASAIAVFNLEYTGFDWVVNKNYTYTV